MPEWELALMKIHGLCKTLLCKEACLVHIARTKIQVWIKRGLSGLFIKTNLQIIINAYFQHIRLVCDTILVRHFPTTLEVYVHWWIVRAIYSANLLQESGSIYGTSQTLFCAPETTAEIFKLHFWQKVANRYPYLLFLGCNVSLIENRYSKIAYNELWYKEHLNIKIFFKTPNASLYMYLHEYSEHLDKL